jgi:hypothetical protein
MVHMSRNPGVRTAVLGVLGTALLAHAAAPAAAQTINVDFNGAETSGTYTGVGAAPDAGTVWNGFAATGGPLTSGPLLDSAGNATGVTASINTYATYDADERAAAFAPALLNDFVFQTVNVDPNSPPGNFSINGLNPALTYDLYLYGQNGGYANTTNVFTVQGGAPQMTTNNDATGIGGGGFGPSAFVAGENYVVFAGVAPTAGGVISGTFNVAEAANNAAFNGFQIVAVPEPASAAGLLALGGVLVGIRRRRAE